jgi:hypothetical protein
MIFIDSKYTRWYYNIVTNAKSRILNEYSEKHHVIPKSCGGSNSKNNLVVLTAKEHFICHLLLTKAVSKIYRSKMIYAFHGLKAKQPKQLKYRSKLEINSSLYQKIKEELSRIKKGREPWNKGKVGAQVAWNKGISPSAETKQKIREARSKQDMSYRKGVSPSIEQREKISCTLKGNTPWNKGKQGTGFGDPKIINPMKNSESIKKMLATRRINKEKKLSG